MPVLATAGSAGCGKDTVADFLEKQAQERGQRVVRLKFAGALRQDLIDGTPEVQTFWRQLYRSLTAPDFSSLMDEPVLPAKFWDKCLAGFSELRERTRAIIKFNEAATPQAKGALPISPMLAPVPSDVINTDDRNVKENPNAACGGVSPRILMQSYGSYMRNAVNEAHWVMRAVDKALDIIREEPDTLIIFTDLRYENEAFALRHLGELVQALYLPDEALTKVWQEFHDRLPREERERLNQDAPKRHSLPQTPDPKFWLFWDSGLPGFTKLRKQVQKDIAEHKRSPLSQAHIEALRTLSTTVVHVERPDSSDGVKGAAAQHESEAGVAKQVGDVTLTNSGTLEQLREATECITGGEEHPLLSRKTLWGTPQTLATAWDALRATGSIEALAQGINQSELLKNSNSLLNTPPDAIAVAAPHAALEMETLLETSRRLAEHSPMGTVLQVLAERVAVGDPDACNAFGPVYSCAGVADRAAEALSEDLNPTVFQGNMDAVIERAVFCQAVANGNKEQTALALESMLEPFFDEPNRAFCEQLAQEVLEQPLRECANAPHAEALQWLQRANEGGEAAPAVFTKDSSTAITAVLCYEPRADVAHAAVQSLLERGDELLRTAEHQTLPSTTP